MLLSNFVVSRTLLCNLYLLRVCRPQRSVVARLSRERTNGASFVTVKNVLQVVY